MLDGRLDGRSDANLQRRTCEGLRRPTWWGASWGRGDSLRCARIGPSPLTLSLTHVLRGQVAVCETDVGTRRRTHTRRGRGQGRRDVRKGGGRSVCYRVAPGIPKDAEVAVPSVAEKTLGRLLKTNGGGVRLGGRGHDNRCGLRMDGRVRWQHGR